MTAGDCHCEERRDEAISLKKIPAMREEAMAKGILIAAMDYSDVAADEFHDWYDTEHIPERLAVPGFLNAERWLGGANPRQSVALYDLDSVSVLQSPPYRAVGRINVSPCTKRV